MSHTNEVMKFIESEINKQISIKEIPVELNIITEFQPNTIVIEFISHDLKFTDLTYKHKRNGVYILKNSKDIRKAKRKLNIINLKSWV